MYIPNCVKVRGWEGKGGDWGRTLKTSRFGPAILGGCAGGVNVGSDLGSGWSDDGEDWWIEMR
jgi:hypothetical protein